MPISKGECNESCCYQQNICEDFPDGGVMIEGAVFIRNNEEQAEQRCSPKGTPEGVEFQKKDRKEASAVSAPVDIKKPVSKRIQNWLNFFYPLSPPKASPNGDLSMPNVSPASSTAGSDVESYPIMERFSPPPRKSILKKKPAVDLMSDSPPLKVDAENVLKQESTKRVLVFLESVVLWETYSKTEYNRSAIDYIARALTPSIATLIKKELNEVKSEMEVHHESKHHTQFYVVH